MSSNDKDPLSLASMLYQPERYASEETENLPCTCKARVWTLGYWQKDSSLNHALTCPIRTEAEIRLCIGKGGTRP